MEETTPDYFDREYRDYRAQNPDYKLAHYLETIESNVQSDGQARLLDIGCGRGAFLRYVSESRPGWALFGTDIEESGLRATRELVPSAHLVRAGATETAFEEETFDVVTAWDVIEHVPDQLLARHQIRRSLKPKGLFVFVVPVYDGLTGPVIKRLDQDPTHLHKLSRAEWLAWAAELFEVVHWHGVFRYLLTARRYLHFPTQRLRHHSPAILVVCRRS